MKSCYYCNKDESKFKRSPSIYHYRMCENCVILDKQKKRSYLIKSAKNVLEKQGYRFDTDEKYLRLYQKIKRIKKKYDLEYDDYLRLIEKCKGLCEICKLVKFQVIDHCHTTGQVRGLLCNLCNSGIGYFKDNRQSLFNAIIYLNQFDE